MRFTAAPARNITCPTCSAQVGQPCGTGGGYYHTARTRKAEMAARPTRLRAAISDDYVAAYLDEFGTYGSWYEEWPNHRTERRPFGWIAQDLGLTGA